jgi:hypothetical protein
MSFANEVRNALEQGRRGDRRTVAGSIFPGIGRNAEDGVKVLDAAVVVLARTIELMAIRIDELEGRRNT